jgi:glycosyltransferase involved in cell wall biosynthesis
MRENLIDVTRLLDCRMQRRLPTGIDRVSLEYVRHFGDRSTVLVRVAGQWIELSIADSEKIIAVLLAGADNVNAVIRRVVAGSLMKSIGRSFSTPRFLFNTGHSGVVETDYARRLQGSALKPVFFLHDLIPITHPEYCRPGESLRHQNRVKTMLTLGHGVIANSEATHVELVAYASKNNLPMPPSTVALLPAAGLSVANATAPIDVPYFLVLGTIEPRKNHSLLLLLWRQLIERFGAYAPRLVVIGQRGENCENIIDLLERCETLKGFVFEYSACSDTELATWLQHARALLFPSFAEGGGMSLVEALSLGVPVIASDLLAFREIAGDIPEYVDPLDGKRWSELVLAYSQSDSPVRAAQCQKMLNFVAPTWAAHFDQVEVLMERLRAAK